MKPLYINLKTEYPETIFGAFDALINSQKTHQCFDQCGKDCNTYSIRDIKKAVKENEQEILSMKEHLEAGFIKDGIYCSIPITELRTLHYDPLSKAYMLCSERHGEVPIHFKAKKPKEAIYFASNII